MGFGGGARGCLRRGGGTLRTVGWGALKGGGGGVRGGIGAVPGRLETLQSCAGFRAGRSFAVPTTVFLCS